MSDPTKCKKHGGTADLMDLFTEDMWSDSTCPCCGNQTQGAITVAGEGPYAYGGDPVVYCPTCEDWLYC